MPCAALLASIAATGFTGLPVPCAALLASIAATGCTSPPRWVFGNNRSIIARLSVSSDISAVILLIIAPIGTPILFIFSYLSSEVLGLGTIVSADLATAELATADLATADLATAELATAELATADLASCSYSSLISGCVEYFGIKDCWTPCFTTALASSSVFASLTFDATVSVASWLAEVWLVIYCLRNFSNSWPIDELATKSLITPPSGNIYSDLFSLGL